MHCAISGQVPTEPVVSTKSGYVFEKRLIEKILDEEEGKCPITNDPLSKEDLIPLKTTADSAVKPRTLPSTSIPGILSLLQNEWDDLMLETFTLKKHLNATREELSHALYQYDAACRVIARLTNERDESRNRVLSLQTQFANGSTNGTSEGMEVDTSILSESVQAAIKGRATELSAYRKHEREAPKGLATAEEIASYDMLSTVSAHRSDKPGVLCLDLNPRDASVVVSGGVDKTARVANFSTGKVLHTLASHKKAVSNVAFHPSTDVIFTASQDSTVKTWHMQQGEYQVANTNTSHSAGIADFCLHPTKDHLGVVASDGSWSLNDVRSGDNLLMVPPPSDASKDVFTSMEFHPDGLILGTGMESSEIRIWDVCSQSNVATFEGHTDAVQSISFNENGYHLVSGGLDGSLMFWDLRKLKNFLKVDVLNDKEKALPVQSVAFDESGSFLTVAAGSIVNVYKQEGKRKWQLLKTFANHKSKVTDVAVDKQMKVIGSTSMDRSLKVYGLEE